MANSKELKERIQGVQETGKITNAMHLIASTKLRRARSDVAVTRPYFDALQKEISHLFQLSGEVSSRYFINEGGNLPVGGISGALIVTSDKGLAGAYNMNVIRQAESVMESRPVTRLFVLGEYGKRYFANHQGELDLGFDYSMQRPTYETAWEICEMLMGEYEAGRLNELVLVYTRMKNSLTSEACAQRVLPMELKRYNPDDPLNRNLPKFEYVPSLQEVLIRAVKSYVCGFVFNALVDSFCAEQNARVAAMDAANRNAGELIESLSKQLNRNRQAAITQEITEVSAGAMAQKRKGSRKEAPLS